MSSTAKHTPGPWSCLNGSQIYANLKHGGALYGLTSTFVATTRNNVRANPDTAREEADAAHIVRCVNAHDDLLAALRAIAGMTAPGSDNPDADRDVWEVARAALAKGGA